MGYARAHLVDLAATPYYHCVSRCVRRAFLCGRDELSGRSFEHRRAWIEARICALASIFAIDVCAYAVMSNHFHVVVRIDQSKAAKMSDEEVVDRWRQVYAVPSVLAALPDRKERIATWRARLCSISWFMRAINEPLARRANKEDDCTGRFWEGRFKSQALLDWPAVLRCMAYVDLNPIRAGLATRPENSHFTSIRARVNDKPHVLVPLGSRQPGGLPISFSSYFGLVAATGHCVARGKHGKVSAELAPILTHLDIDGETWMLSMQKRRRWFRVIGTAEALQRCAAVLGFGGLRNASVI